MFDEICQAKYVDDDNYFWRKKSNGPFRPLQVFGVRLGGSWYQDRYAVPLPQEGQGVTPNATLAKSRYQDFKVQTCHLETLSSLRTANPQAKILCTTGQNLVSYHVFRR